MSNQKKQCTHFHHYGNMMHYGSGDCGFWLVMRLDLELLEVFSVKYNLMYFEVRTLQLKKIGLHIKSIIKIAVHQHHKHSQLGQGKAKLAD